VRKGFASSLAWLIATAVAVVVAAGCVDAARPAPTEEPARASASNQATVAPGATKVGDEDAPRCERERRSVEADDGHALVVWSKSPPEAEVAVVLIHGRTWSSIPDFDLRVEGHSVSLMDDLCRAGFATYAVDLRGYGGTERDATGWTTPERSAHDVERVLEFVAARHALVRPPALFGWSNGAVVAQHVAQRRPDAISDLVLYGYPTGPHRTYSDPKSEGPARAKTTVAGAAEDFITPTISEAVKAGFVKACLEADPVRADWRGLEVWNELDPAKVTVPTMLIHGEHDPYARAEAHAAMMTQLGHGDRRWVVVAEGDHAAHLERVRGRFVAALVGFLGRRG